jgi:hypothetical protein
MKLHRLTASPEGGHRRAPHERGAWAIGAFWQAAAAFRCRRRAGRHRHHDLRSRPSPAAITEARRPWSSGAPPRRLSYGIRRRWISDQCSPVAVCAVGATRHRGRPTGAGRSKDRGVRRKKARVARAFGMRTPRGWGGKRGGAWVRTCVDCWHGNKVRANAFTNCDRPFASRDRDIQRSTT